ncbi:MAG: xanthine dehydrogenase family protein [Candidatus Bathyarchaeota archaeon]|nr:MAG: xanthine dehydrogenase family protein [Candidatus Bathyarchaeota archaeon]
MVIGESLSRKDAWVKVKGEARYNYDLVFPDEQHLVVVRSPHAHAKIKKIQVDREASNQLKATVGTAEDIPGKNIVHVIFDDWPLLAKKMVFHVGQPVAIVVARSVREAELAASAIRVEYEVLPAVFDPVEAMDHPSIHIFGEDNVCSHWQQKKGDVERGFADADVIVEGEYRTRAQEHSYIEPQGCIAVPLGFDEMTVYGSMQCPFYVKRAVSEILGYPMSGVTVIQTTTGGAFGGKEDQPSQIAGLAALGAHLTKRPVKYLLSREEDIETTSKRHPAIVRAKTGATADGLLTAVKVDIILNTGAFSTLGPAVLYRSALHAAGPYRVHNVNVQAHAVTTNLVPFGAFRGFGSPQVLFACEEQIDRIAEKLNMDPVEFRERNLIREGDVTTFGQRVDHSVGMMETLKRAKERSGWTTKWKPAPNISLVIEGSRKGSHLWRGIGASTIFYGVGLSSSGEQESRTGAYVQLESDGSVTFAVGTTEIGQGMMTVLSQIVAAELGVDYERVRMAPVDTSRVPDSGPTVASRSTTFSGRALQDACKKLRSLMFEKVAPRIGSAASELKIEGKFIVCSKDNEGKIPVADAIKIMHEERGQVSAVGWDVAPPKFYDNEIGQGKPYVTYAWCTNIVEVEVDVETGTTEIKDVWAAHDVGKAINPQTVEGQIEGGSLQGLGFGRYEEIVFSPDGGVLSNNLSTYVIPTTLDAPNIYPIIVESPWEEGPYGAKGFGEQPLMGIAPAVTNAIYNAIGVRLNEVPATPKRVWKEIQGKMRGSSP